MKNPKYKIIGNENLTNGSKITIKVTDKNGKEKNYYINIIKDMSIPEKEKNRKTNHCIFNNYRNWYFGSNCFSNLF